MTTFAAEPLMPETLVRDSWDALSEGDDEVAYEEAIEELARDFRVSPLAMTHRLTNLKIISSDDDVAG